MFLNQIRFPIIQAPMAGGAATPELAAAELVQQLMEQMKKGAISIRL